MTTFFKPRAFAAISLFAIAAYTSVMIWVDNAHPSNGYIFVGIFETIKIPCYFVIGYGSLKFFRREKVLGWAFTSLGSFLWMPGQALIAYWTFSKQNPYITGVSVEFLVTLVTVTAVSGVIAVGFHGLAPREKIRVILNALSFGACMTFIMFIFISKISVNGIQINIDDQLYNLFYFSIDVMLVSFPLAFFLYRRMDKAIVWLSLGMIFLALSDITYLSNKITSGDFDIYTRVVQLPGLICWVYASTRSTGKPTKHVTINGENYLTIGVNCVVFATILFSIIKLPDYEIIPKTISYSFIAVFVVVLIAQLVGHFENKYLQKIQQQSIETITKSEEKYQTLATHDTLTNLYNRTFFIDSLNCHLEENKKSNSRVAILFVDLDRFKEVNDNYGHSIGDSVISEVAQRIFEVVGENDLVCRLGGDEFAVLVSENASHENVNQIASTILKECTEPIVISGIESYLSCSIGIAFSSSNVNDSQTLLRNADAAMYRAKELGRNRIEFSENLVKSVVASKNWSLSELRHAVAGNQIVVYYQPVVDMHTDLIVGLEALARWNHPEKGLISPIEFIPVAEDNGLIIEIGNVVLQQSIKKLSKWNRENCIDQQNITMSINISCRQLNDAELLSNIKTLCAKYEINPNQIIFEMTESSLLGDVKSAISTLNEIKSEGFNVYIDDFGTGYSSLTYLKKFPIDGFKIDKSFVQNCCDNEEDKAIVESLVNLGKSMNLNVTAEGIDSPKVKHQLTDMGCLYGQGYLFSKPLSADEIIFPVFDKQDQEEDDIRSA